MEEEGDNNNKYLSEEQKWLIIISFHYFNLKQSQISERFNLYQGTVSKILSKYESQGNPENNHHLAGRKPILEVYPHLQEAILDCLEEDPLSKQKDIQLYLNKLNYDISISSINIQLKEMKYLYRKIQNVHELTQENKDSRLNYCKYWQNKSLDAIWYSDESVFLLDEQNGFIWTKQNSDTHLKYSKQQQYKNRILHVWGAISLSGKTNLYIHNRSVDSDAYIECIQETLLPAAKLHYYRRIIKLEQDGARSHTSKKTQEYFEENDIKVIQNPSWSPDLVPIELIWGIMKGKWNKQQYKKNIQNKQEFIDTITDIWDNISQTTIIKCIEHIKIIMKKVIQFNGAYITLDNVV